MLRSSLVILVLALSASASAEDFDYSFLSIGYGVIDFDDIGVDGDGLNIGGSFAINDTIHLFAEINVAYSCVQLDRVACGEAQSHAKTETAVVNTARSRWINLGILVGQPCKQVDGG